MPLVSEFQPVAAAAGLRLKHHVSRFAVRTDFRLLTRILRTFSNACRYTDSGGAADRRAQHAGALRIEVWDTGRESPEELQAIFLEFNQLGIGRSTKRSGWAGLAIVDRIANMLDYPVLVRSRPGRGSVFSIDVPLADASPRERIATPVSLLQLGDPLPGRRLLVIDNEESILLSMTALLEQWAAKCSRLPTRRAPLALDGRAPDAVLADYHLDGGLTGWDVVLTVRERFGQALPVVMITADRSDECRQQLQGCGVPVSEQAGQARQDALGAQPSARRQFIRGGAGSELNPIWSSFSSGLPARLRSMKAYLHLLLVLLLSLALPLNGMAASQLSATPCQMQKDAPGGRAPRPYGARRMKTATRTRAIRCATAGISARPAARL